MGRPATPPPSKRYLARRPLSLRALLGAATFLLTGASIGVAAALMVASTSMQQATRILIDAMESVRIAERMEIDLLLGARQSRRIARGEHGSLDGEVVEHGPLDHEAMERGGALGASSAAWEQGLRQGLSQARRHVSTPQEGQILEGAEQRVEAYLAIRRSDEALDLPPSPGEGHPALDEAFSALDRLVDINLRQARASEALVARLGRRATAAGLAAVAFFVAGAATVLVSARRLVYRPIVAIQDAIGRYGAGDRAARAPEIGPREIRDIARVTNTTAESLERQREAQFAFLGGVAHDLRNPLSALRMSVSLLSAEGPLPESRVRKTMALVGRQVDRLERMVGDLLAASQIEARKLELKIEERDLRELAQAAVELYRPVSSEHTIALSLPAEPVLVRCDPTRIEQVLNNLLSNAVKYSPQGGEVEVAVRHGRDGAELTVRDQGIGIAPEDLAHLFEPFQRLKASATAIPGTGLGLAVAKRIVEAHGGRLVAESRPGEGSVFRVELPR